jgi:iron complex outermembrane recepter protein
MQLFLRHPVRQYRRVGRRSLISRGTRTLVAASLGAVAIAMARPARAQDASGIVAGKITSADGSQPLGGATIFVTGAQTGALSRTDGTYRIALRPGKYELRVRFIGWTGTHDSVTVAAGQTVTKDFALERSPTTLEALAVVGTRGEARTVTESPVPIDVLTSADIVASGRTETSQILQMLAPSFNFPRPSISDGSDHVRPATLRGLGPDQVLVLINGKRRHNSALVNVNGTVGRGSTGVDLNAIPASMIERIEVLRDGAAAQYGSDAIAGVINIVLKGSAPGEASGTFGQTAEGDGQVANLQANAGSVFGQQNYFHAGVEYRDRGFTNRAGIDPRNQYFAGDPRNSDAKRVTLRLGDAATQDVMGMLNTSYTTRRGIEFYAFGGASNRDGESAANWRLPNGNNTVRALWPNGFLPLIETNIWDVSGTVGAKGTAAGWQWDLSSVYGRNSLHYDVSNSNNASMGASSPTDFDAGGLVFGQSTTNLDFFKQLSIGTDRPLRTAVGAEFRMDNYQIEAGDSASWKNGGQRILDGPNANSATVLPAPGAQGFPGFRPTDEQDASRNNYAVYVDLESDITSRLLLGVAGRFEDYSDFGSTTTAKATARFALTRAFALRGAFNTGFRAPSLGQSFFSSTATNLVNGQFLEILTLPVSTAGAKALGAKPLKPEKSTNYSAGLTFDPSSRFSVSVDYYHIDINDRIVFSENFIGAAIQARLAAIGLNNVTGARYFTNAIDTRTDGIDVVTNYGIDFRQNGVLRLTGGYNQTHTRVTDVIPTPPELSGFGEALFGRAERGRIEVAQPRDNVLLSANYTRGVLGGVVRAQRYGEVTNKQIKVATNQPPDQTFSAKWVTDVSGSYRLLNRVTLGVGADNVFDVYPDVQSDAGNVATGYAGNANFGMNPYSGISPFGFNGRFFWAKVSYGF